MATTVPEHVQQFAAWIRIAYPDFAFHAPGGWLTIRQEVAGVRRVRLQLRGREALRLHSVALDTRDLTDPVAQVTVRASDVDQPVSDEPRHRLFASDGDHQVAVETTVTEEPWLELELERPVTLQGLRVRNAELSRSEAMASLRIAADTTAGSLLLYDGETRAREFEHAVLGALRHGVGALAGTEVDPRALTEVLREVALGRFTDLPSRMRQLAGATPADRRRIRRAVNDSLLAGQAWEWNIHSVRRTFRHWRPEERAAYLAFADVLVGDLQRLSAHACLGFGGVLGLVREGDLIGHDDDLDVIIAFGPDQADSLAAGLALVEQHLRGLGYRVWGEHQLAHRFVAKEGRPKIDVFVGLFEGDTVSWYPGPRGVLRRDDVFPPLQASLQGQELPIPRNPTVYLEKVYGPRWRTPNPTYSHRWGRRPYEDIAGSPST